MRVVRRGIWALNEKRARDLGLAMANTTPGLKTEDAKRK